MKLTLKYTLLAVVGAIAALGLQAKANTILAVGDSQCLGYVNPGLNFGDGNIPGYVNIMIPLALGETHTEFYAGRNNTWVRSMNDFGALSPVVSGTPSKGNITSFNLGLGVDYLLAKYDGPNAGLEIWYVGNLSGIVEIPATASGGAFGQNPNKSYGLSGTWLLNGGGNVPDGGTTALLLGVVLSGLGLIRRTLS